MNKVLKTVILVEDYVVRGEFVEWTYRSEGGVDCGNSAPMHSLTEKGITPPEPFLDILDWESGTYNIEKVEP